MDLTRDIRPIPCHSHNDYWRSVPLYSAIRAGCVSVEADVWLLCKNSSYDLYVGHSRASLTSNRTLKDLYIDPLVKILDMQNPAVHLNSRTSPFPNGVFDVDASQSLTLLLDFKTSGADLWPHVLAQLEPLRSRNYLTYFNGTDLVHGPVTAVCTGGCPFDLTLSIGTNRDIFFDAPLEEMWEDRGSEEDTASIIPDTLDAKVRRRNIDNKHTSKPNQTQRDTYTIWNTYYASTSFSDTIGRIWRNRLSSRQINLIRGQIRGAHRRRLKVRYWDLPDWPIGWRNHIWEVLIREGVDVLNVDDLDGAAKGDWGNWRQ